MRLSFELASGEELSKFLDAQLAPGPDEINLDSTDAEIDEYVKTHSEPAHHICGTCRMGAIDDPLSVCDEEGSVIGVQGLRVVDCSLMPDCVRANTQATTYMIAERIAAVIRTGGDLEAAIAALETVTVTAAVSA